MTEQEFAVKFARMVLKAQEIHKKSWDEGTDPPKTHLKAVQDARSQLGAMHDMIQVAYMLNVTAYNEIQDWAKGVLDVY